LLSELFSSRLEARHRYQLR